jgi:hypothetical protein
MTTKTSPSIPTLSEFLDNVESSEPRGYLDLHGPEADGDEFHKMKNHILGLYRAGVESAHSFRDENGQIFDCIPWDHQPSVEAIGQEIFEPPPTEPKPPETSNGETRLMPQLSASKKDQFGNAMFCESGTVPFRRPSLDEFANFRTFDSYFLKSAPSDEHRYAYVSRKVLNRGLGSRINIWRPEVLDSQTFSLSQIWCTAGSWDDKSLQTVEVGWHVYPKFGMTPLPQYPHLFIYWTPDCYKEGGRGSYNQAYPNKEGFIVREGIPKWLIGGAQPVSDVNIQISFKMEWRLRKGDHGTDAWWLGIEDDWVGFYPTSLFGVTGALTSSADSIIFGGETCCDQSEPTFPPMGSGILPTGHPQADFGKVAYHKNLFYYAPDGKVALPKPEDLNVSSNPPATRYGIRTFAATEWGTYFFFGGPGGRDNANYVAPIGPLGPGS